MKKEKPTDWGARYTSECQDHVCAMVLSTPYTQTNNFGPRVNPVGKHIVVKEGTVLGQLKAGF